MALSSNRVQRLPNRRFAAATTEVRLIPNPRGGKKGRSLAVYLSLTISLPGCSAYNELNREALLAAGEALGLPPRICERELTWISRALLAAMDELVRAIRTDSAGLPEGSHRFLAGETRLLDAIRHIVTSEILGKLPSTSV